ncbi:MAG: class I SAM-dependent methyltransferase [Nitrospira sp.]|nr:class I SAM-dependent methyltransferase [Nitrospira sp.]
MIEEWLKYPVMRAELDRLHLFEEIDARIESWLLSLWTKYRSELIPLSLQLADKFLEMTSGGFGAAFGDSEGELLYMLVRERRPSLIYEISPNSGYSTNYLLAAVTRNGVGSVEGFEIEPRFLSQPTEEVILRNLVPLCDPSRYHLNIGDARFTTLERLRTETPDFLFLDSCHEDFFAEFYVKQLLPRVPLAFVQDIVNFDPRPAPLTEAYYLLAYLQETSTRFLSLGLYDDGLNASGVRNELRPRRPIRSNSVVFSLHGSPNSPELPGDFLLQCRSDYAGTISAEAIWSYPLNASLVCPSVMKSFHGHEWVRPEDRYVRVWYGGGCSDEVVPRFSDLIALKYGRGIPLSQAMVKRLVEFFERYDAYQQVLVMEILVTAGHQEVIVNLMNKLSVHSIGGADLPMRIARIAFRVGLRMCMMEWVERGREAALDTSLAVGYRNLLQGAALLIESGESGRARDLFRDALTHIKEREGPTIRQANKELLLFCVKRPSFFLLLWHSLVTFADCIVVATFLWGRFLVKMQERNPVRTLAGWLQPDDIKGIRSDVRDCR